MSWHFSRALVEAFSEAGCSAGEPSARSNSTSIAATSSCNVRTTESLNPSPSGTMCAHSMADCGTELLTWYRSAFRAKASAPPDLAQGSKTPGVPFGGKARVSFARFDLNSSSWKTPQLSLLAGSDSFSENWPAWGMMRNGECSERMPPVFLITEPAFGWLPTPSGVNGGRNNTMGRVDEWGGSSNPLRGTPIGQALSPNFEETVIGWPTDWTALTPLETAKFQQWLDSHGKL